MSQAASGSGIFEINLAALTDAYGRDLRLDCCAWQNVTTIGQQQQQQVSQAALSQQQQQQSGAHFGGQQQSCDPTKCQLIMRICVKNYQTQIDPSQCTFGELSAQVMRPNEQAPLLLHSPPGAHLSGGQLSNAANSLARLQHQQQLAALAGKLANGRLPSGNQHQQANIHHQRMMLQQLQLQANGLPTGQPRALRQIYFDHPISFPFNFTWPVSVHFNLFHPILSLFHANLCKNSPFSCKFSQISSFFCKFSPFFIKFSPFFSKFSPFSQPNLSNKLS